MTHSAPPTLEGLHWRPITRADLSAVVVLAEKCQAADGGLAFLNTPDHLRERYFPEVPCVTLGAWSGDGELIAANVLFGQEQAAETLLMMVGQVRPTWRRLGLGHYLMRWGETQARALSATNGPRRLQIRTESLTEPARQLYQQAGFGPVMEELVMRRDLSQPLSEWSLPSELNLTSWRSELAEQFFQAYHASFRERPGFPGWSAAEWIKGREEDENARPEWSLLALSADRPVGFITAGEERPGGFVVQLGVIPEMRRRGLASALLGTVMRRMQLAGEPATQLTVNVNNPEAIATYQQMSFIEAGRRARFERLVA